WFAREVEIINFASQTVDARVKLSDQPADDAGKLVQTGKKFFFTSTGRWSNKGWGSCAACHPDGLSDGVTWVFGVGPRQTLAMDSDFNKKDLNDQRMLNWTAIND